MLKLLNMKVEGFCSIPSLYVPFDQKQTILIKAPNGSGKSTIFSALVWGLYGKTIKGVSDVQTWKRFRTKDYKGTMVSVFFQNKDSVYQIIRCQKYEGELFDGSKGKDRLLIVKDAELLDIKGKTQQQQKIVELLGLSQTLFTNSIMFGQGINRMIQESNSDKKKLFEEVFDLNYLNVAKNIAVEGKNNLQYQLREVQSEHTSLLRELETAKSTYKDLKSKERDFNRRIKAECDELNQDRGRLSDRYKEIQKKVNSTRCSDELKEKQKEMIKLRESYNKAKSISNIPVRDFIGTVYDMIKSKKYNKALHSLEELIEAFKLMESLDSDMEDKQKEINLLNAKDKEYNKYKSTLEDIQDDISSIDKQLNKLKEDKLKVLSPKYKERIREIKSKISDIKEQIDAKELELGDYTWVIDDPLGNNGIKAYLFDSSLEFLNAELDRYSDILGFHISFEIDLNSSRKEFVTLIERDGQIMEYDELSGGEKQLVDISMAFAMNQALTVSKGINIAFLDELFESLSFDNIELVIGLVKEVYRDKTLFLISHHDSLPFSNVKTLEVEKRAGLSYYKGL